MKAGLEALRGPLEELARTEILLVASDYDGTLAPLVSDPAQAWPEAGAGAVLSRLARLAGTHVAVLSGRGRRDLRALARFPEEVFLVGSHGGELDADLAQDLPPELRERRRRVLDALTRIARRHPGFRLEEKPAAVAFHYRGVAREVARAALEEVRAGPGAREGVVLRPGKEVLELLVHDASKGQALEQLRRRFAATAVLFLGDDLTDEDAFAVLSGPDLAVKVGEGPSRAPWRLRDPEEVVRLLALLHELRSGQPIGRWSDGTQE